MTIVDLGCLSTVEPGRISRCLYQIYYRTCSYPQYWTKKEGFERGPNNGRCVKCWYIMRDNEHPIASSSYEFMHSFRELSKHDAQNMRIRRPHRSPARKLRRCTLITTSRGPSLEPVKRLAGALTFAPCFTKLTICIEPIHEYAATLRHFCMHGAGVEEILQDLKRARRGDSLCLEAQLLVSDESSLVSPSCRCSPHVRKPGATMLQDF